jgi:uncharacterized protein DUF4177
MRRLRFVVGIVLVTAPVAVVLSGRAGLSQASSADEPPVVGEINPRPKTVPQRQWEYKQTIPCAFARGRLTFEEDLNEHGKKGWELVSLMPAGAGQANRDCFLATFKRETLH